MGVLGLVDSESLLDELVGRFGRWNHWATTTLCALLLHGPLLLKFEVDSLHVLSSLVVPSVHLLLRIRPAVFSDALEFLESGPDLQRI